MDALWPWLAVAAAGALHGLNPASGWAFGACSRQPRRVAHALLPIAAGHIASLLTVAAAVPAALELGVSFNPLLPQGLAAGLLLVLVLRHAVHRARGATPSVAGKTWLALWSFIVGMAHGTGWMLVPALAGLCSGSVPAREITASGSLALALAALGVHLAAMLTCTALMTLLARRVVRGCGSSPVHAAP